MLRSVILVDTLLEFTCLTCMIVSPGYYFFANDLCIHRWSGICLISFNIRVLV